MVEMIVVPVEPDAAMQNAALGCEGGHGWREIWSAMLAAAPDSGTVPVPRGLLERAATDLERMCDTADLMPDHVAETISMLRALLAASKGGAGG